MYDGPILAGKRAPPAAVSFPGYGLPAMGPAMTSKDAKWIAVASLSGLTDQTIVCMQVASVGLILVRDGDQVFACERACPHERADLSLGHITDGRLHCPRHMAWFDLRDGEISPGWTSRALRRYPVRIENDHIWIDAKAVRQARGNLV